METNGAQIVFRDVCQTYRPARSKPVLALDRVTFDVRENESLALLGPSGCGKSTLLYALGGFQTIDSGAITVRGKPVVMAVNVTGAFLMCQAAALAMERQGTA